MKATTHAPDGVAHFLHSLVQAMIDDALPDPVPGEFTFRPWNHGEESWDDFIRALECAYARYAAGSGHLPASDQTPRAAPQDDPGP